MALNLKIITPDGIFFNGDVETVNVKTTEGYLGIFEWHIPTIANIAISTLMFRTPDRIRQLSIAGGLLVTSLHEVRIITDKVEYVSVLKAQEVSASQERINQVRNK